MTIITMMMMMFRKLACEASGGVWSSGACPGEDDSLADPPTQYVQVHKQRVRQGRTYMKCHDLLPGPWQERRRGEG